MSDGKISHAKGVIILVILLFISFTTMGFSQTKFTIQFKSVLFSLVYPFQYIGVAPINLVKEFFTSIEDNRQLKVQLSQTKNLLQEYERTQYEFEELKRENERLRRVIGIQEQIEYDTVIAEVVAKSPQDFYKTLVVNRGRDSGVERYMPVIAYQNNVKCVVGKVTDVQRFSARIQPLVEQSSYVGAMLKSSRYSGILMGQSPLSELCLLQYMDKNAEMKYGDLIVTSGMGGVFPKGIAIGEVVSVSKKRYGIFQEAFVKPKIDFGRLEEVYIITKKEPEGPAEQSVIDGEADDSFVRGLEGRARAERKPLVEE
jgi:rod shape-determining protein MreC